MIIFITHHDYSPIYNMKKIKKINNLVSDISGSHIQVMNIMAHDTNRRQNLYVTFENTEAMFTSLKYIKKSTNNKC